MPETKPETEAFTVEVVEIATLKPHPRNYRSHPDDEIEHLMQSIKENGTYRNVVIARDGTILAGHGVIQAKSKLGHTTTPAIRLDLDPDEPRALKVLTGDNEIAHLVVNNDRLLSELLREVKTQDLTGLLGTGYDEMMLANLVMVTRPQSEIQTLDEAAHWVGMPGYSVEAEPWHLLINFDSQEDRAAFADKLGIILSDSQKTIWWPARPDDDTSSLLIDD